MFNYITTLRTERRDTTLYRGTSLEEACSFGYLVENDRIHYIEVEKQFNGIKLRTIHVSGEDVDIVFDKEHEVHCLMDSLLDELARLSNNLIKNSDRYKKICQRINDLSMEYQYYFNVASLDYNNLQLH